MQCELDKPKQPGRYALAFLISRNCFVRMWLRKAEGKTKDTQRPKYVHPHVSPQSGTARAGRSQALCHSPSGLSLGLLLSLSSAAFSQQPETLRDDDRVQIEFVQESPFRLASTASESRLFLNAPPVVPTHELPVQNELDSETKPIGMAIQRSSEAQIIAAEFAAELAARRSAAASTFRYQSHVAYAKNRKSAEVQSASLYQRFVNLQADRQAQISAENAMTAYYGLAALQLAEKKQLQLIAEIDQFQDGLQLLQSQGVSIQDNSQLVRARIQAREALLDSQYGIFELRSKLSLMIGSEQACSLNAEYDSPKRPEDICTLIDRGFRQRPDLGAWYVLMSSMNSATLELVTSALDNATLVPSRQSIPPCKFLDLVFGKARSQIESELQQRRQQVQQYINNFEQQLRVEIEVAWQDADLKFLRWTLAGETADESAKRLEALEVAAEQGMSLFEKRIEAKLELRKSELEVIRRWFEFQQARTKLLSATGSLPKGL